MKILRKFWNFITGKKEKTKECFSNIDDGLDRAKALESWANSRIRTSAKAKRFNETAEKFAQVEHGEKPHVERPVKKYVRKKKK